MWWVFRGGKTGRRGGVGWMGTGCGVVVGEEDAKEGGKEGRGGDGDGEGLTRLMMASWFARCVLQCLQPKMRSEVR